jgi:transposase-like protein
MAEESVEERMALLREVFREKDGVRRALEYLLRMGMEAELEQHLGAGRYVRSEERRGQRNGYKPRTLRTRVGELQLKVPQVRDCEPYQPSMWSKWQRSERAVLSACAEMYFQGVSTRKVQDVLQSMCDGRVSAMTVSRVTAELDEHLSRFRKRRLDGQKYPFLQIDARYEHVRVDHRIVSQAVLVVIGYRDCGRREVLSWGVGDSENEQTWGELFRDLKDRGLAGLELVSSDAHGGIRAALARHFQGVSWQRCQVHFKRELWRKVGSRHFKAICSEIATVFAGHDKAECLRRGQEMAERWRARYPAVSRLLESGLEDCLTAMSYPRELQKRVRSTNLSESIMRMLKRRTSVVGVFPNRASCDRLIGALLVELHEQWLTEEKPILNLADWRQMKQEERAVA